MTFKLQEAPEFDAIPTGVILEAKVIDCKLQESPFYIDVNDHSKGKQEQVSFRFKITQPTAYFTTEEGVDVDMDVSDRQLFGNTPTTFTTHPDCKLRGWVQEILGVSGLPADFELELEDLIDAPVKVIIGNYTKKGTSTVKDFVADVMRIEESGEAYEAF